MGSIEDISGIRLTIRSIVAVTFLIGFCLCTEVNARTINCTATVVIPNATDGWITYDHDAGTCHVKSSGVGGWIPAENLVIYMGANGPMTVNIGKAGSVASTDYESCTLGTYSGSPGSACVSNRFIYSGNEETASISYVTSDGSAITANISYTVGSGAYTYMISSAIITTPKSYPWSMFLPAITD